MPPAPVPRLDGAAIHMKNLLYVFAGYGTIDYVHSHVDVFNFTDNTWGGRFPTPKDMANSHLRMATDERYVYVVSGQYGPQCRKPIAKTFVLDTGKKKWESMPPLPSPRTCVVVNDRLFVFGGQEGDFMAKPGCSRRHEDAYSDVYMLDNEMKWKVLAPMPKRNSHTEFAWKWSVIGKLPYCVKTIIADFWKGWLYFTSGLQDRGHDNPQPQKVIADMGRTKSSL